MTSAVGFVKGWTLVCGSGEDCEEDVSDAMLCSIGLTSVLGELGERYQDGRPRAPSHVCCGST